MTAGFGLILALGIIHAICYGPEAALFSDLFDPSVRYTGISFVYQFSGIFASGIAPMVATRLLGKGNGTPWLVAGHLIFAAVVSCLCALVIARGQARGR